MRSVCSSEKIMYDRNTMKRRSSFIILAGLALMGAGCSQTTQEESKLPMNDSVQEESQAEVTTPEALEGQTNEVSATESSNNAESKPDMDKLAFPGVLPESETNVKVRIKTNMGDIVVQLDPKAGPNAASNFVYLVKKGFYNGTIFHRVIDGFMIQGGDPTGSGTGGPGYRFADDAVTGSYAKGTLAMANAGPNTNGSQFFIMVEDVPLAPAYSIFGKVISGQDVADKISLVDRNPNDKPLSEVKMLEVVVE